MMKTGAAYEVGEFDNRRAIVWGKSIELRGPEPGTGVSRSVHFWEAEALEIARIIAMHFPSEAE